MADQKKTPKFQSGTWGGSISLTKTDKRDFTCELKFRSGHIDGSATSAFGSFHVVGDYKNAAPFKVQMKLTGAFGMDEVAFVGYHAANPTIFGTWSGGGGAGDLFLGYKELTPEEKIQRQAQLQEEQLSSLISMGFDEGDCLNALACSNNDTEKAIEWLMNGGGSGGGGGRGMQGVPASPENIAALTAMGFGESDARDALAACVCCYIARLTCKQDNVEAAIELLFAQQ